MEIWTVLVFPYFEENVSTSVILLEITKNILKGKVSIYYSGKPKRINKKIYTCSSNSRVFYEQKEDGLSYLSREHLHGTFALRSSACLGKVMWWAPKSLQQHFPHGHHHHKMDHGAGWGWLPQLFPTEDQVTGKRKPKNTQDRIQAHHRTHVKRSIQYGVML